jgi:hypothetical protein
MGSASPAVREFHKTQQRLAMFTGSIKLKSAPPAIAREEIPADRPDDQQSK